MKIKTPIAAILLCAVFAKHSFALTLTSAQTNFTTTENITTSGVGIGSSLVGTSGNLNKITNLHIITTGPSSSAYGIRTSGNYNQITNEVGAQIQTSASSGRGISIGNLSIAVNKGLISTQGSSSYGLYAGGDNNSLSNSGNITTAGSSAYGIYLDGNSNSAQNSGIISTAQTYGIYISAGSSSTASALNHNVASNSGTINSGNNGIYNKDNFSEMTNSGTITSADVSTIYGIRNEGSDSVISNSGTINSNRYAIYNSGDNVTINNSGTLAGGVRIGNSTLNILGGSISGEVEGNDAGNINIFATNFSQSADFSNLNSLTIKSGGGFTALHKIDTPNIFLENNSNFNLENGAIFSGNIQGNGNLNLVGINFSTNSIATIGNSLANLNIDLSSALTATNDIYADNIFVNGELNSSSAFHGNLDVSGKINIGSEQQIIYGNFALNSGAIFSTTLENNSVGNFLVSGDANVDAASKLSLNFSANNDYIADGTKFTLLDAANPSTISAINSENISINGNSSNVYGLLRFKASSDSRRLFLEANHLAPEEISSNKNVQNIYKSLNEIGNSSSGKLRQFQSYIDGANLSKAQLNSTINQLAPNSTKASLITTSMLVNNSLKIDERRLEKTCFNVELPRGFFAEFFGNALTQNALKDDEGFSSNSAGFSLGFDDENSGASFSYGRSTIKSDDDTKINSISSYQLNFFRGQKFDEYFLDMIVGGAFHQYDSRRAVTALKANTTANYNGQSYVAKIKSGFVKEFDYDLKLIPEFSLNFLRSKIDGYLERGSDTLNLKVGGVSANFLEARIGANFGIIGKIPNIKECKKILALLKISYGYNIINSQPTTTARFIGSDVSFNTKISQIDRSSLRAGFEFDFIHTDDVTFSLDYMMEKRSSLQSHFLVVKARQEF